MRAPGRPAARRMRRDTSREGHEGRRLLHRLKPRSTCDAFAARALPPSPSSDGRGLGLRIAGIRPVRAVIRTVREVVNDDITGLSAELAYRFFLSLFPFVIFVTALGGFVAQKLDVGNPVGEIMSHLGQSVPPDAAAVIEKQLQAIVGTNGAGLLSVGILGAVWAASSGFRTVMKAMNRAYDVKETRAFWKQYALSIGLTLLAGSSVIAAFVLLVVGQVAGSRIADAAGLSDLWGIVVDFARWPVAIVLVLTAVAFLYWAAPNITLPFRWVTPGSVVFVIGWLGATYVFSLYVSHFGSYNKTYGTLGGVVVLMLWFYLISFILLLGAEINRVIDELVEPGTIKALRREVNAEVGSGVSPPGPSPAPHPAAAGAAPVAAPRFGPVETTVGIVVTGLILWRLIR